MTELDARRSLATAVGPEEAEAAAEVATGRARSGEPGAGAGAWSPAEAVPQFPEESEPAAESAQTGSAEGADPGPAAERAAAAMGPGWAAHKARARRWLPWASLAVGVFSALWMDRGPGRALFVAVAAGGLWVAFVLFQVAVRAAEVALGRASRWVGLLRFSALTVTQSLTQLCLFFSLPLYFRAASWSPVAGFPEHAAFLLVLAVLSLGALWDPLTEWLLRRRRLSAVIPVVASFVGLNAVLPTLGVSTAAALWWASAGACAGVLVLAALTRGGGRRKRLIRALLASLALPVGLVLGGARAIPPAPLRLVRAEMGTDLIGKWVSTAVSRLYSVPERLICATAIASPVSVRDRIEHVWLKDGHEVARRQVEIVGGRSAGFRTRSWIRDFGAEPEGDYVCRVQTGAGQVLGACHVVIAKPDS